MEKEQTELKLTGKKARKLSKKRGRLKSYRRFQMEHRRKKLCRMGASPRYQNNDMGHFAMAKRYSRWRPIYPFDFCSEWVRKAFMGHH
jgi:hypothetical protein